MTELSHAACSGAGLLQKALSPADLGKTHCYGLDVYTPSKLTCSVLIPAIGRIQNNWCAHSYSAGGIRIGTTASDNSLAFFFNKEKHTLTLRVGFAAHLLSEEEMKTCPHRHLTTGLHSSSTHSSLKVDTAQPSIHERTLSISGVSNSVRPRGL